MRALPLFTEEGCWARDGEFACNRRADNNLGLCDGHLAEFFGARDDISARQDFVVAWRRLRAGLPPAVLVGRRSLGSYLASSSPLAS
jgi:hypothetical protein